MIDSKKPDIYTSATAYVLYDPTTDRYESRQGQSDNPATATLYRNYETAEAGRKKRGQTSLCIVRCYVSVDSTPITESRDAERKKGIPADQLAAVREDVERNGVAR